MSNPERARRYLQADMAANYTGLPGEAKEAHEATMRSLERAYPGVKQHALIGSDQDFDKPLRAGEREHQSYMRSREGMTHGQVLEHRKQLHESSKPTRPAPRPKVRHAARAGARGGRSYYRAARQAGIPSAASSTGSTVMQAIGIGIGLSLLYLVLSPKGSNAFSMVLGGVVKAIDVLIQPIDPLSAFNSSTSPATPAQFNQDFPTGTALESKLRKRFESAAAKSMRTPAPIGAK